MKPVDLIEYPISNSSEKGDVVLDLFGGSGSTLIACEQAGRQARLMELDQRYCDVIVRRWQELTGRTARLEGSGMTFAEAAAQRGLRAAAEATARIIGGLMVAGRPFTDAPAANDDSRIGEVA